jgi:hypothetical protein
MTSSVAPAQFVPGQVESGAPDNASNPVPNAAPQTEPQSPGFFNSQFNNQPIDPVPPTSGVVPDPTDPAEIDLFTQQQMMIELELQARQQEVLRDLLLTRRQQLQMQQNNILNNNWTWYDETYRPYLRNQIIPPGADYESYGSRFPGGYYGYPVWHPSHPNFNRARQ